MTKNVINSQCCGLLKGLCNANKIDFLLFVFRKCEKWSLTDTVISTLSDNVNSVVEKIFKSNTEWSIKTNYSISQFLLSCKTLWGVHFQIQKVESDKYSFRAESLALKDQKSTVAQVEVSRDLTGALKIVDDSSLDLLFFKDSKLVEDRYHIQKSLIIFSL